MDNECLHQIKDFKCVGCDISYEKKKRYATQTSKICPQHWEF